MDLLAKFVHGSHLYRLNTPESDRDYKGVYMPSLEDILLGDITHSFSLGTNKNNSEKNTKDDVDYEVYSIHKWVELLSKGEMVCFDMLFAPEQDITYYNEFGEESSEGEGMYQNPVWIIRNEFRHMFVHSDMKAYLGYCRRQSAKYGIKGSRLHSLFEVQRLLEGISRQDILDGYRLSAIESLLPTNEYLKKTEDHYEVLGKKHQWTTYLAEFCDRISSEINRYGNRAILAEKNEGIDWKAISHAFRAGEQIRTMLMSGNMDVVLGDSTRDFILSVKKGELDWETDVKPSLESLMASVELLAKENPKQLPEKPDKNSIKEVLLDCIKYYYGLD